MWVQRCMMPSHWISYTPSRAWNLLMSMFTLGLDGHSGMNWVNTWLRSYTFRLISWSFRLLVV